jgi:hypothetical protein
VGKTTVLKKANRSMDAHNRIGLWRGYIEDDNDPKRLGRVRVRVPLIHGPSPADILRQQEAGEITADVTAPIPTEALPWADITSIGGGGHDFGDFDIPPIGTTVYVMFEMGDEQYPIVVGGSRGTPKYEQEMLTIAGAPDKERTWMSPAGESDTPEDVFANQDEGDNEPSRKVWRKSFKGHTILVEDRDGEEFLQIIDRAGQVIEMSCPVTPDANKGNASQRGALNQANGTGLPHESFEDQRAYIRLKDASGQQVMLDARKGLENITITSQDRYGANKQELVLSSVAGAEGITMTDKSGNTIKMDGRTESDETIVLQDRTGSRIVFNAADGSITQEASGSKTEKVRQDVTQEIEGTVDQAISGDKKEAIVGNKIVSIVNDMVTNVFGSINKTVGGAFSMLLTNTFSDPANNALSTFAFDIQAMGPHGGGHRFHTLAGPIQLSFGPTNAAAGALAKVIIDPLGVLGDPAGPGVLIQVGIPGVGGKVFLPTVGGVIINDGVIPCNDLPACLFTGAPHGVGTAAGPKAVLVP